MKAILIAAAIVLGTMTGSYAEGDAPAGSGATSTTVVVGTNPETGRPQAAVVVSTGGSTIVKGIEAP